MHSTHSRALPTRGAPKVTHTTSAPRRGLAASAWPTSLAEPKRLGRPCRLRATSSELIVASAPPRECPVKMICRTRGYLKSQKKIKEKKQLGDSTFIS